MRAIPYKGNIVHRPCALFNLRTQYEGNDRNGCNVKAYFSQWLQLHQVQAWLYNHPRDYRNYHGLSALHMDYDQSTRKFTAKAAGWRPEWLGGAPSNYREARVELMKRYYVQ